MQICSEVLKFGTGTSTLEHQPAIIELLQIWIYFFFLLVYFFCVALLSTFLQIRFQFWRKSFWFSAPSKLEWNQGPPSKGSRVAKKKYVKKHWGKIWISACWPRAPSSLSGRGTCVLMESFILWKANNILSYQILMVFLLGIIIYHLT